MSRGWPLCPRHRVEALEAAVAAQSAELVRIRLALKTIAAEARGTMVGYWLEKLAETMKEETRDAP